MMSVLHAERTCGEKNSYASPTDRHAGLAGLYCPEGLAQLHLYYTLLHARKKAINSSIPSQSKPLNQTIEHIVDIVVQEHVVVMS